jgi:putative endonuclease
VAAEEVTGFWGRLRRRLAPGQPAASGWSGEEIACRHLRSRGYVILERNFRCRSGEVDIVARQGEATVFVEVKERRGESHGLGHEAVTFGKRRRVICAARLYAASRALSEGPLRFDVVSIDWTDARQPRIRHDEGAFDSDGR